MFVGFGSIAVLCFLAVCVQCVVSGSFPSRSKMVEVVLVRVDGDGEAKPTLLC